MTMKVVLIMEQFSPQPWLELGTTGAVLFIVLFVVWLVFNSHNRGINQLCDKIDRLIGEFSKNQVELARMIMAETKDQQQMTTRLDNLFERTNEIHKRVVRIDTRLYEQGKYDCREDEMNEDELGSSN